MKKILILTTILMFVWGMSAIAQPGPAMGCKGEGRAMGCGMHGAGGGMKCCPDDDMFARCNMMDCAKELGLTDEQVGKMKDLNFTHRTSMIGLEADFEKAQLKIRHEMMTDNPDKTAILLAAKEINTIQGYIAVARINHMFDLRSILNAEQLTKWQKCQAECKGKCGPGMMAPGAEHKCDPAKCDPAKCPKAGGAKGEAGCMHGKQDKP